MLQFVLSPKSVLVEGDAEFILMEALYKRTVAKELSSSVEGSHHYYDCTLRNDCFRHQPLLADGSHRKERFRRQ